MNSIILLARGVSAFFLHTLGFTGFAERCACAALGVSAAEFAVAGVSLAAGPTVVPTNLPVLAGAAGR